MFAKFLSIGVFLFFSLLFPFQGVCDESNRNQVRANLEAEWRVIWGHNFVEADWVEGIEAIAESIAIENPAPFLRWFSDEINKNFEKIMRELPEVGEYELRQWIIQSLENKNIIRYKGFRIDAGFVTYNRWQIAIYDEPGTYKCKLPLPFGGWTWGICPTTERVEKRIPLPNHNQFYVRYKLIHDSQTKYHSVYYKNNCHKSIHTAIRYKNSNDQWETAGWWQIEPGESAFVAKTKNRIIYIYAESADRQNFWSGKDKYYIVRGSEKKYGFKEKRITNDEWGKWVQSFSCN